MATTTDPLSRLTLVMLTGCSLGLLHGIISVREGKNRYVACVEQTLLDGPKITWLRPRYPNRRVRTLAEPKILSYVARNWK